MHVDPGSSACRYQHAVAGYCLDFMQAMVTMTPGSSLSTCDSCTAANNPDWLGTGSTIPWVATTVLALTENLTLAAGGETM